MGCDRREPRGICQRQLKIDVKLRSRWAEPTLLQLHHLLIFRHGDFEVQRFADVLGEAERDFFFAVGDEKLARRRLEIAEPFHQPVAVGVAGDALDLRHPGADQARAAVDADLAVAVEDLPAQRALRLVADEQDRALGPPMCWARWCLMRPAVHMPEVDMMMHGPLKLLIAFDSSWLRTTLSAGNLNSDRPAASISSASASKQSRWSRKTSFTSAAIGLSRNTGISGIFARERAAG